MQFLFTCSWCGQPAISNYRYETICRHCDSQLIDLEHSIYSCAESEQLLLNGYNLEDIRRIIDKDMTYVDALSSLVKENNKLIDSF